MAHSFQFDTASAANEAHRLTTGIPTVANAMAFDVSFKIPTYPSSGDFGEVIGMRSSAGSSNHSCGVEISSAGAVYYNREQNSPNPVISYTETNIWTDGRTTFTRMIGTFDTNVQKIWTRSGGTDTAVINLTEALQFAIVRVMLATDTVFPTDMSGLIAYDKFALYNANKTQAFLDTSSDSRASTPPDATACVFWNDCTGNTSIVTDSSGNGNNWTQVGATTDLTVDSWGSAAAQTRPLPQGLAPSWWDTVPARARGPPIAAVLAPAPAAPDTVLRVSQQQGMAMALWVAAAAVAQQPQEHVAAIAAVTASQVPARATTQGFVASLWPAPDQPRQRSAPDAAILAPPVPWVSTGKSAQARAEALWPEADPPQQRLRRVSAILAPPVPWVSTGTKAQAAAECLWPDPDPPQQRKRVIAATLAPAPAAPDTVLTGTRAQARGEALWPEADPPQQRRKMFAAVRTVVTNTFSFTPTSDGHGLLKNGVPFTVFGCALWAGCVHRTDAEFDAILDAMEAVGMNMVQIELWSFNSAVSYGPANVDGDLPWTKNVSGGTYDGTRGTADMQFPNDTYWAKVKTRLEQIEARGFMIFAGVSPYGFYGADQGILTELVLSSNDVAAHEQFADYLVSGSGGTFDGLASLTNLTIFLGSDAGTNSSPFVGSGDYTTSSVRQLAFMQRLKAQGLTCLMGFNGQSPTSASDEVPFDAEVSFNPTYTYGLVFPDGAVIDSNLRTYQQARHTWNFVPTLSTQSRDGLSTPAALPAFLFETAYFGSGFVPGTAPDLRKAMNWAVLSGCTAGYIWGHEILYILSGSNATLVTYLQTDSANDVRRFTELCDVLAVPLSTLVPSELDGMPQIVVGARGSQSGLPTNYIAAAADPGGACLLIYVPPSGSGSQSFDIDLTVMSANCRIRAYDPTLGTFTAIATNADHTDTSFTVATPGNNFEGANDWFLLVDVPGAADEVPPVGNKAKQLAAALLWAPPALPIQRASFDAAISQQVDTVLRTPSRQLGALALWSAPQLPAQRAPAVAGIAAPPVIVWKAPTSGYPSTWPPEAAPVQRAPAIAAVAAPAVAQVDTVLRPPLPIAAWPAPPAPVQRAQAIAAVSAPVADTILKPANARVAWPAEPAPAQRAPAIAAISSPYQADQFPHAPLRFPSTWPAEAAPVQRAPAIAAIDAPAPTPPGTVLHAMAQQGAIQVLWLPGPDPVQRRPAVSAVLAPAPAAPDFVPTARAVQLLGARLWVAPVPAAARAPGLAAALAPVADTVLRPQAGASAWPAPQLPVQRLPSLAAILAPAVDSFPRPLSVQAQVASSWAAPASAPPRPPGIAALVSEAPVDTVLLPAQRQLLVRALWELGPVAPQRAPSAAAITAAPPPAPETNLVPIQQQYANQLAWQLPPVAPQRAQAQAAISAPPPVPPGLVSVDFDFSEPAANIHTAMTYDTEGT